MCQEIDILALDAKIQQNFIDEYNKLPTYKSQLDELILTLNNCTQTKTVIDVKNSIVQLEELICKIESKYDHNFYISETIQLLERYKHILKTPLKLSFTGRNKIDEKDKQDIIDKYIAVAQKYEQIEYNKMDRKSKMTCSNCGQKEFNIEENVYICSNCGVEQDILQQTISYKDTDRVNITTKYTYDPRVHFRDCINQYQGKQNCSVEQKVYDDLEHILERHHLLGQKDSKKEIRFAKITKEHISMFLKELSYSKHYENINLIHYNLTGKKPDDISHLEENLISDFGQLVDKYDEIYKNKVNRVNFISTQFVLYQLLLKYKHPCRKEDFVILKTSDRKEFHDNICRSLFNSLGWNYSSIG